MLHGHVYHRLWLVVGLKPDLFSKVLLILARQLYSLLYERVFPHFWRSLDYFPSFEAVTLIMRRCNWHIIAVFMSTAMNKIVSSNSGTYVEVVRYCAFRLVRILLQNGTQIMPKPTDSSGLFLPTSGSGRNEESWWFVYCSKCCSWFFVRVSGPGKRCLCCWEWNLRIA